MENMADNRYSEDEEAQRRIDQIRKGSGLSQPPPSGAQQPAPEETPREAETDSVARARSRAASARSTLRGDSRAGAVPPDRSGGRASGGGAAAQPQTQSSGRSTSGLFIIGGVVLVGILIVALIFAISQLSGGEGLPIALGPTDTPTATPTATATATPTETPTPTPTLAAPTTLGLPPLTCIFDAITCEQYCANPDNRAECDMARDHIAAQDADPDFWFACLEDTTGENEGNEFLCLEDAWRANQGAFDTPAEQPAPTLAAQ